MMYSTLHTKLVLLLTKLISSSFPALLLYVWLKFVLRATEYF